MDRIKVEVEATATEPKPGQHEVRFAVEPLASILPAGLKLGWVRIEQEGTVVCIEFEAKQQV